MVSTWHENTNYYVKLNQGQLKQVLGKVFEGVMIYKPRKDKMSWLLKNCMRSVKYLTGNKVAISIQLTNALYVDYKMQDGSYLNTQNVVNYIDEEDFQLAMHMFGVYEFMTQLEYDNLTQVK